MDIARRVYDGELTLAAAAVQYGLNISRIKSCLTFTGKHTVFRQKSDRKAPVSWCMLKKKRILNLKEYELISKNELIDALVMAGINEACFKKVTQ